MTHTIINIVGTIIVVASFVTGVAILYGAWRMGK